MTTLQQGAAVADLEIRPANEATWHDLTTVFGTRGPASRCWCQRYKLKRLENFADQPVEERQARLRDQTGCGDPRAPATSGLVAYLDGEPAGWCAVEPRPAIPGLRHSPVPWQDRDEDPADPTVWAITCVFARAGLRRRGISKALIRAAVEHARTRGAARLEAYPMTTTRVISEELHLGTLQSYLEAGFTLVGRPTLRRAVVEIIFDPSRG